MNRRGFMGLILGAAAAPAIVRAASLMPVRGGFTTAPALILPNVYQDNLSDIIAATIRMHSGRLAENIMKNNALLRRLKDCGVQAPWQGGIVFEDTIHVKHTWEQKALTIVN